MEGAGRVLIPGSQDPGLASAVQAWAQPALGKCLQNHGDEVVVCGFLTRFMFALKLFMTKENFHYRLF